MIFLLTSCKTVILNPAGDIASQESKIMIIATLLMLLIIIPVIILTIFFAWRYRKNNTKILYSPNWDHSSKLEIIIWGVPLLIIILLGSLTWISTHKLDPHHALSRLDAQRLLPKNIKPLVIEVVALNWKWLFIYPTEGIASVNEIAVPIDIPIHFKITSSSVMNSFYIPALAGQIYAMPNMQTELNAIINKVGKYDGFSANYSGDGFSDMRFKFYGLNNKDFNKWITLVKSSKKMLKRTNYQLLETPSINNSVQHFSMIDPTLYNEILNRYVNLTNTFIDQQKIYSKNTKN